eukprot:13241973-Alexandrium_andersonii.AAC.1
MTASTQHLRWLASSTFVHLPVPPERAARSVLEWGRRGRHRSHRLRSRARMCVFACVGGCRPQTCHKATAFRDVSGRYPRLAHQRMSSLERPA